MRRRRRTVDLRGPAVVVALVVASCGFVVAASAPAGAIGTTYTVTAVDMCGGPGSFEAALTAANANPGTDTITFTAGLKLSTRTCADLSPAIHDYPLSATDSVNIIGNGATVYGDQIFVNAQGRVNDPNQCPEHTAGTHPVAFGTGFLEVGTFDADNSAVTVNVDHLDFDGMPSLFQVEKNASLSLQDSDAEKTLSFNENCSRTPIFSNTGNVALNRVLFRDSSAPTSGRNGSLSTTAVVAGFGGGTLTMDHVRMYYNFSGRAVAWVGTAATIVSSQFYESGGLWLDTPSSQVVNTALHVDTGYAAGRVIVTQGHLRTDASTFYWSEPVCDGCQGPSMGIATGTAGSIELHTTAIGGAAGYAGAQPLVWGNPATFTSDNLTWVQPVGSQDPAAIAAILPNALTSPPGLTPAFNIGDPLGDVTPLLGSIVTPGVLIDAVATASCVAPNDANALYNPIDASCITTDVFGKPRWDTGNDTRNIGAIQSVDSPHLIVAAVGNATIDLQWNRPTDPPSGPVTGYALFYRPAGAGPWTRVDLTGPGTLAHQLTGLTNGVAYEAKVAAVNTVGDGPDSNTVVATPLGPVGTPAVSAVPGPTSVQLFWTDPDTGGHPGPLTYFVVYRPVGSPDWVNGPGQLSGRTALLPDLACGVTYEFGVIATTADGATSPQAGTTTAAATDPCPPPTTSTTSTSTTTTIPAPAPVPAPTPARPVTAVPTFTG